MNIKYNIGMEGEEAAAEWLRANGYEILFRNWRSGRYELDIVATKGFRSIIVECKAVQKLDLEYYHKLHSIAEHFGKMLIESGFND